MLPSVVAVLIVLIAAACAGVFGHRFHAATPAVSLVLLIALLAIPRLFVVDGFLLPDIGAVRGADRAVIQGLAVGIVALGLLAFLIVGFAAPLVGAVLAVRRDQEGARRTLVVHGAMGLAAITAIALQATPAARDAEFALVKAKRTRIVSDIASGAVHLEPDAGRLGLQRYIPPGAFPRVACCGNVVYVLDAGRRVLFPMTPFGAGAWGYVHDTNKVDDPPLQTLARYDTDWRLVAIDWTAGEPKAG